MGIVIEGMCTLIQVFDMPTALSFYRNVLGFEVTQSAPEGDNCDWCRLNLSGVELMLNTQYERNKRPSSPDPASIAAHGDTSLFFGCRDLDAAYKYLLNHNVDVKPPVRREYGMTQLTFRDPDGYNVCLQWQVP